MRMIDSLRRRAIEAMMDDDLYRQMLAERACAKGHILVEKFVHTDPNDPTSPLVLHDVAEGHNLFLNAGINRIWDLVTGASAATYTNAESQIGIGDSNTAAAAGQTDLQAAVNKTWKAMDATYPPAAASQSLQFRSTFGTADANYVWAEFAVRRSTGAVLLDRGVSAMGTKTAAGVWVPTVTLSIA